MHHDGFAFSDPVPLNGYRWWYVDALSDDGTHGLTIIGFIGSVFSPYYKWRRRNGTADPANHCAINVALYGRGAGRWSMTERPATSLRQAANSLSVGPSSMTLSDDGSLVINLSEIAVPWLSPIRGSVRVTPDSFFNTAYPLDSESRHRWQPIAPRARVDVVMECPALKWSGHAYLDTNWGDEPLERAFLNWQWSRASDDRGTYVFYDASLRDGGTREIALYFDYGGVKPVRAPPFVDLKQTGWRVSRSTRSSNQAQVVQTLEDTPFYARSVIASECDGRPLTGVHESLDLERFSHPIVQAMLPFRMPRTRK